MVISSYTPLDTLENVLKQMKTSVTPPLGIRRVRVTNQFVIPKQHSSPPRGIIQYSNVNMNNELYYDMMMNGRNTCNPLNSNMGGDMNVDPRIVQTNMYTHVSPYLKGNPSAMYQTNMPYMASVNNVNMNQTPIVNIQPSVEKNVASRKRKNMISSSSSDSVVEKVSKVRVTKSNKEMMDPSKYIAYKVLFNDKKNHSSSLSSSTNSVLLFVRQGEENGPINDNTVADIWTDASSFAILSGTTRSAIGHAFQNPSAVDRLGVMKYDRMMTLSSGKCTKGSRGPGTHLQSHNLITLSDLKKELLRMMSNSRFSEKRRLAAELSLKKFKMLWETQNISQYMQNCNNMENEDTANKNVVRLGNAVV